MRVFLVFGLWDGLGLVLFVCLFDVWGFLVRWFWFGVLWCFDVVLGGSIGYFFPLWMRGIWSLMSISAERKNLRI